VAIKDNKVVGVAFNKVQNKSGTGEIFFEQFGNHNCKASLSREYINIMIWVSSFLIEMLIRNLNTILGTPPTM
jgi:hypothetical protein